MGTQMNLELSPQVFSILSNLIKEKVGINYGLTDREILHEKVSTRAMELGYDSLLDYYYFLRYDASGDQEMKQLVETLVINETYFFREWPAIETLVESYLKPMCASGKKPRIWSAACATGEEPLSLAMLLEDKGLLNQVQIIASDISENALKKAHSCVFSKRAVRQVPQQGLLEKFIRFEENHYTVSTQLRDSITWQQVNILDEANYPSLESFDVILCRNLLIYFSDQTVKQVLEQLARKLSPDGILMVGISESLLRFGGPFIGEEQGGSFFYKKNLFSGELL